MKKLFIIFTLQTQDGENRYSNHSPQIVEVDENKDQKEQINEFGEELAKDYYGTSDDQNGEWYEFNGGCKACRYYSFEIIEDEKTFELIKRILQK